MIKDSEKLVFLKRARRADISDISFSAEQMANMNVIDAMFVACVKWHPEARSRGQGNRALCLINKPCGKCPLYIDGMDCRDIGHPYGDWLDAADHWGGKDICEKAQAIYELILGKLKEALYE